MNTIQWLLSGTLGFLYHIAPPVIAVAVGSLVFQRYFVSRANECSLIDYLVKGLDELREDALEYWNLDSRPKENKQKARILEQKIKAAVKNMTSDLNSYSDRYCKKSEFGRLMMEVSDACTGGLFESAKRTPESGRYLAVVNSIHHVKWELMRRKL